MALFLQILLAVVLVLLGVLLSAWWWFKRWMRRTTQDYAVSNALIDAKWLLPARVQLQILPEAEFERPTLALWEQCQALGFELLADFSEDHGAFSGLRMAKHCELPFAAVLSEQYLQDSRFMLLGLSTENRLFAFGSGPEPGLSNGAMQWQIDAQIDPARALDLLSAAVAGLNLRAPDSRLLRSIYERAHAARMDAMLAIAPGPEDIQRIALQRNPAATPTQIEQAQQIIFDSRHERICEAALDHFRRNSKIDAVRWEEIKDRVHVVYSGISQAQLFAPLFDADEQLLGSLSRQFQAQGHQGAGLFERVLSKLPGVRFERLGEVQRPLAAVVYTQDREVAKPIREMAHLYEATNEYGEQVRGTVYASGSGDAKKQLSAMGFSDCKVLMEPVAGQGIGDNFNTPEMAAIAAKSASEPLTRSLVRAFFGNFILWLPPALWVAWSLNQGQPFGWGDYLGFAYAFAALAVLIVVVAPMILYHQLLRLRVMARWSQAQLCLSLLRRLTLFGGLPGTAMDAEQAKIIAGRDGREQALAYWQNKARTLTSEQRNSGVAQILGACGDFDGMITTQRRVLAESSNRDFSSVDLAMSLAQYVGAIEEAEELLSQTSVDGLSELALGAYHFTRGLICACRDQHSLAINQYSQALDQFSQFAGNPLTQSTVAEISGFVALSLKLSGNRDSAESLWRSVLPLFEHAPSGKLLIARYEAA